jgi:hypothetical protein
MTMIAALLQSAVEVDLLATTTTHCRSAPIAKLLPCSYVADVEDH